VSDVVWEQVAFNAVNELSKRDHRQSRRIADAVYEFARTRRGDVKKLRGSEQWRLRVGDWRVIFTQDGSMLKVEDVVNRRDAYD
jgi:mRNA interferase RelE/StbE